MDRNNSMDAENTRWCHHNVELNQDSMCMFPLDAENMLWCHHNVELNQDSMYMFPLNKILCSKYKCRSYNILPTPQFFSFGKILFFIKRVMFGNGYSSPKHVGNPISYFEKESWQ